MTGTIEPQRIEDVLATQLGIDQDQFLEVYGAGWSKLELARSRWDVDLEPPKPGTSPANLCS